MQEQGQDILIMELLTGGTLEDKIGQAAGHGKTLQSWDLRRYWYEISLALKYLHSQGTMHRDLKPANVLLIGMIP
jgi:eukaryotic-like serine/threonine-protein kinase